MNALFDKLKTVGMGYASATLHISSSKLQQMIEKGELPAYVNKATGRIRIAIDDINLYKERIREGELIPYQEYKNSKRGKVQQGLEYED